MRTRRLVYRHSLQVPPDAIDELGHVNNVVYLGWLQDAARAHSDALGWTYERYRSLGSGWVVRSHFLEYLRPAFQGDELTVVTWVASVEARTSMRRYRIERDGREVLRAETNWAFVDFATGRPQRIPEEVLASFPVENL